MVKNLKDPNAPKRPMSAYFAWMADNRAKVVKTMPVGYSVGELGKAAGQAWKNVDEATKKRYEDAYKSKRETYNKLYKAYKQTANYAAFERQKKEHKVQAVQKTKFRKDENAPKKPMTAYFLWMGDNRATVMANNPGMNHKGALSKLGEMWKSVTDEQKKPYQDKAAILKKTYEVELEKYKTTDEFKTYQDEKAEFMKSRNDKLKKAKKRARGDDEDTPKPKKKAKKAKKARKSKKKPKAPKKAVSKKAKKKTPKKRTARKAK